MSERVKSGAILDPTRTYRYCLWRHWGSEPVVAFVMLNPSTADADVDDPTIRRCVGFSKSWGYGGIVVVNLFAFRATSPRDLWRSGVDRVGPENRAQVLSVIHHNSSVPLIVAAWGAHDVSESPILSLFDTPNIATKVHALGFTKDGHPKHPLYLRADCKPQPCKLSAKDGTLVRLRLPMRKP